MLRHIVAIASGVIAGAIVVAAISLLSHQLFPPVDFGTAEHSQLSLMIGELPITALLFDQLAWFVGALSSAWLACRMDIGEKLICGVLAALLLLAGSVVNLILTPSPLWFILLTPAVFIGGATIGLLPQLRGPQPG